MQNGTDLSTLQSCQRKYGCITASRISFILYLTDPSGSGADFVFSLTATMMLGSRITDRRNWLGLSLTLWFVRDHYVWNNSVGIIALKIML